MDMTDKDEFVVENSNCENGVENFNSDADWRISGSNPPVLYHPEENPKPISQMMDSSRQNLWHDGGGFNARTEAGTSNVMASFRGNIERPLDMGWSLAQFPADSGFTEREAKFSLFGCGNFSEMMMNQQSLGVPDSVALFLQDTEIASSSKLGDGEPLKVESKLVKDRSNGSSNVSEESHSSGGNGKKRKRFEKVSEADQSRRAQEEKKQKDEQSPNSHANKTTSGKQASDPLKDGYSHMRARRGQATNSHSLAERVRREKISERMKFLQDLVPGCDKVTGKAVILDEIINYVQSLQCQIEFLSMKLSTVNPLLDFNLESLIAKDALQSSAPTFPQSMSMLYPPLSYLSQTGLMQPNLSSISPLNGGLKRQETHGYESDHHNVVHMNHGTGTAPDHEDVTDESNTKVEP